MLTFLVFGWNCTIIKSVFLIQQISPSKITSKWFSAKDIYTCCLHWSYFAEDEFLSSLQNVSGNKTKLCSAFLETTKTCNWLITLFKAFKKHTHLFIHSLISVSHYYICTSKILPEALGTGSEQVLIAVCW